MADDRLAWKFRRAARQRLVAVNLLMEHRHHFDAVYLAGYVVECGLKALLLSRTPESEHAQLVTEVFRGQRGHDFSRLGQLLREKGCRPPHDVIQHFVQVSTWTTSFRYEPGIVVREDAMAFVYSAEMILGWAERSM